MAVILWDFGLKGNVRLGGVFAAPVKRSHLWKILLILWLPMYIIILGVKTNTDGGYIMKRQSTLVLVKRRIWEIPYNVSC